MLYYILFSYLFVIGFATERRVKLVEVFIAPVSLPVIIGRMVASLR